MTTARLWVFSDLHIDSRRYELPAPPPHDVIVVAGDVADGLQRHGIPWIREHLVPLGSPVIFVPGNHDYFRSRWQSELAAAREALAGTGIHVLAEGETVELAGVRFVGATLWTDYGIGGYREVALAAAGDRVGGMLDHRRIKHRYENGETNAFRPPTVYREHVLQRGRIERALAVPFFGPTVVVTHHGPHPLSLQQGVVSEVLDASYASDLTAILESEHAPSLWIHGHVHRSRDYRVGGTRVVSNPRGRWVEPRRAWHAPANGRRVPENADYDPSLVLEV